MRQLSGMESPGHFVGQWVRRLQFDSLGSVSAQKRSHHAYWSFWEHILSKVPTEFECK